MTVRRVLCALLLTYMSAACGESDNAEIGQPLADSAEFAAERALAEQLVVRVIAEPGRGRVSAEIDHHILDSLARLHENEPSPLSDPLTAARVFRWTIGLPPSAELELLERQSEAGAGSGLFVALVRASTSDQTVIMRLVSDPSSSGQPTLWTLNDYETKPR